MTSSAVSSVNASRWASPSSTAPTWRSAGFHVTHTPSGNQYRIFRGEIDAVAHPASAFYFLPSREVVLLERVKQ